MTEDYIVVIPARYASSRLPGKPLEMIGDQSLIQHVCQRASASKAKRVVVATDDKRIYTHLNDLRLEVVMTDPDCPSGTDRIAQALDLLNIDDQQIVVNLQGDEPFMPPVVLDQMAQGLSEHAEAAMCTGCEQLHSETDFNNPNVVKVVRDKFDMALYFSRSTIPHLTQFSQFSVYKHLGIYAYRAGTVRWFASSDTVALETVERLEQLRMLWHGKKILVKEIAMATGIGVDTPEDLQAARDHYAAL